MKIKLSIALFLMLLTPAASFAGPVVTPILKTEVLRCGTDLSIKSYARKEDGQWKGFDADICRVFAWAIYGDGNKFKMVDVRPNQIKRAFNDGLIDVMLSGSFYSAAVEARYNTAAVGLLYYDRQMFAAKQLPEKSSSMADFKGKKVCVSKAGDYLQNLKNYNQKYELNLTILPYNSIAKAREALLLKRCDLLTANSLLLQGLDTTALGQSLQILPEEFAHKPVYAFVARNNNDLRIALKWVINALYLAEENGITQKNIKIIVANEDASTQNLLGENDILWRLLKLQPDGLKQAIGEVGNMGEIYERNFGPVSPYKLDRGKANLIKNGGIVHPEKFE